MAKIESADGQSAVILSPVAYQFAEASEHPPGEERLQVHAGFRSPHCSFSATCPALSVAEAGGFISRLTEWIHGDDRKESVSFAGPDLAVRLLKKDERGLRVSFRFAEGFAPPDSERAPEVHIRNLPEAFAAFCEEFSSELALFPERTPA